MVEGKFGGTLCGEVVNGIENMMTFSHPYRQKNFPMVIFRCRSQITIGRIFCMINFTPELTELSRENNFVELTDIYDWHTKKSLSLQMSEKFLEFEPSVAERMYKCGSWLEFAVSPDDEKRLINARFCKHRLCPMCGWRRSRRWYSRMIQILNHPEMSGYEYLFLTLTVKNVKADRLKPTIRLMFDGFKKMATKDHKFKAAASGWYRTLEITYNSDRGDYHPHIHVLIAVNPSYFKTTYIDHPEWVEMWRRHSQLAYNPVVHVKKVYERKGMIAEVTKYVIKPMDIESCKLKTIQELNETLYRVRAIALGGRFKAIDSLLFDSDDVDDDLVGADDENATGGKFKAVEAYYFSVPDGKYIKVGELTGKTRT